MDEGQKLRLDILRGCGYNVEAAQKCLDFVRGGSVDCRHNPLLEHTMDGVYYIYNNGFAERFIGSAPPLYADEYKVEYIGLVEGYHSMAIALHDASMDKVTLTTEEYNGEGCYIGNYRDAVQDWQGKQNTERLKAVGLNPAIQLCDDEYIPALAELYLICFNQKVINAAIRLVGGQEIKGWYWSSTERCAISTYNLCLNNGFVYNVIKATSDSRVRPIKEFNI